MTAQIKPNAELTLANESRSQQLRFKEVYEECVCVCSSVYSQKGVGGDESIQV